MNLKEERINEEDAAESGCFWIVVIVVLCYTVYSILELIISA